ncbi:hypothetical protein [Anaerobium acetethylicum]|uniref:Uncharacterized protein n=1 Tax=Anaerobium acetethylicum TaxID=1619234 RepID=A0A1D3TXI9_9FIRM|nr:hypothetical protein [Anaerobium acetethylicum]SCP99029.1 hypothetical protein SAMN05421730_10318 [Anaerobium acetethylicum]
METSRIEKINMENIIYDHAKNCLKRYARMEGKGINEKIRYECALLIYGIRQQYRVDTRNYTVSLHTYEGEIARVFIQQSRLRENEAFYEEALEACKNAMEYIEMVLSPRLEVMSMAC